MIVHHYYSSHFPIIFNSLSSPSIPRINPQIVPSVVGRNGRATARRRSNHRDEMDPVKESDFFNENGVVEDMDAYLNYLSLEYESVWDTKPSWCQPWTISATGIGIVAGSWLALNSVVVTSAVAALICLWWYLFLYSYPKAYSDMIAERRKKVTSGLEDTYGMKAE